jgi:uncharacterized protein YcaQ
MDPALPEQLLRPGEPLFEYWGHEACWMPLELFPVFEFRRVAMRRHRWYGTGWLKAHRADVRELLRRIREEGPLRSLDMSGARGTEMWDSKHERRIASSLWTAGELAIRERQGFQRSFDLTERVIPAALRQRPVPEAAALEQLLCLALRGHGWATTGTLAATWRLRRMGDRVRAALRRLVERGGVVPCALVDGAGKRVAGWIEVADLELAARLEATRPRGDRGVLLSPFDPVLWDRARVQRLFDFEQVLEIYKPASQRRYGYYCLPVLAGERLVARLDLKAERRAGRLRVLSCRFEGTGTVRPASAVDGEAVRTALERYANALELAPRGLPPALRAR